MVGGFDIEGLRRLVAENGAVVRVVITAHQGSTPREAGTVMLVTDHDQLGTIGGGALEYEAVAQARKMLKQDGEWLRNFTKVPLGPSLGQCCGGAVSVLAERFGEAEIAQMDAENGVFARPLTSGILIMPLAVQKQVSQMRSGAGAVGLSLSDGWLIEPLAQPSQPLWIYGAGHVGRALVTALQGLPYAITWVDSGRERFPDVIPDHVDMLVASNPADAVRHAPKDARHLVLTYSHAVDFEICYQVLSRPFAELGLIGSDTKKARFLKRLKATGVNPLRLQCPIGDRSLGKEPMAIAVGIVAELLAERQKIQKNKEVRA